METIQLPMYKCLRCGHTWVPRKARYPRMCPKCQTTLWDEEKKGVKDN